MPFCGLILQFYLGGSISFSDSSQSVRLFLNSGSIRRAQLLEQMGLRFEIVSYPIFEKIRKAEKPHDYVVRMAREKSIAGFHEEGLVIGADTIVVLEDTAIGKPLSPENARETLDRLSGRNHLVLTAVSVYDGKRQKDILSSSLVKMKHLSNRELDSYCKTGEPLDKAGSYAIQGIGGVFIESISGSYSGIVGLPIEQTEELLLSFNIDTWKYRISPETNS